MSKELADKIRENTDILDDEKTEDKLKEFRELLATDVEPPTKEEIERARSGEYIAKVADSWDDLWDKY